MSRKIWVRITRLEESMKADAPPPALDPWENIIRQINSAGLEALEDLHFEYETSGEAPDDQVFQILVDGAYGPEMFTCWMESLGKGELAEGLWREHMRTYNERARAKCAEYLKLQKVRMAG